MSKVVFMSLFTSVSADYKFYEVIPRYNKERNATGGKFHSKLAQILKSNDFLIKVNQPKQLILFSLRYILRYTIKHIMQTQKNYVGYEICGFGHNISTCTNEVGIF